MKTSNVCTYQWLRSFFAEEIETFKVKKSSHSKRIAKQIKKESKKEKEERERAEREELERSRKAAEERARLQRGQSPEVIASLVTINSSDVYRFTMY